MPAVRCIIIQYTATLLIQIHLLFILYEFSVCPPAAPVSSALSAHYSHRSVVIMGGLICSIGVMFGAFARNLIELYLTVGFLNGEWFEAKTHIQHKLKNIHTKHDIHWNTLLQVWAMQ